MAGGDPMRIVGGRDRGAQLAALGQGDAEAALRPSSDRVRESLFNLLAHGGYGEPAPPVGARVLDLFAGTGALGLEALSRGAMSATFVENGHVALDLLGRNIDRLGAHEARVLKQDATRLGANAEPPFDLVFLDPPYGQRLGEAALARARAGGWIAPGALVIWEERDAPGPVPGLTLRDARRYGNTMITILRHDPAPRS